MLKGWTRLETWLAVLVAGVGLLLVAIPGLWVYMSATATPLHPDAQTVPSVTLAEPSQTWAGAVSQGRRIMRAGLTAQNLPGLSVAVGAGGDIVWAEGFGWADLEERVPVSPGHRFRIGTASTVLTSAAAGLLLDQGRLRLDDDIWKYVPEFPAKPWPVTLRHVMGHVAGLRSDGGDESALFAEHCVRPADALPFFADAPLLFEPGTRFRFSNYGWIAVSAAIEAAAGEPLLTFMRDRIFDPLRMRDTGIEAGTGDTQERATPYFPRFAADPRYGPDPMREIDLSCYAGAMAFVSTPSDLVRFGLAVNGGTLLKPGTVAVLQRSLQLKSGQETGYGLGWGVETVDLAGGRTRTAGHDGHLLGGPVVSFLTFPDHRLVVVVASNSSYADTRSLALQVARAFAEQGSGRGPG